MIDLKHNGQIFDGIEGLQAPPKMWITALDHEPTAEQVADFDRTGVGRVERLLTPAEVDEIREEYQRAGDQGPRDGLSDEGMLDPHSGAGRDEMLRRFPRMLHPHRFPEERFGQLAMRWMLSDRIATVLRAVMGEEPLAAQSMFYFKGPGARGQSLHQDNNPLGVKPGTCMAAWIAVDDCDEENGALVVVPGTGPWAVLCNANEHKTENFEEFWGEHSLALPEGCQPTTASLKAGDVLFFNGSLVHGSYRNRSHSRFRRSLIFHYAPESCEEIKGFYHPLLDMKGNVVERRVPGPGAPCGGGWVKQVPR